MAAIRHSVQAFVIPPLLQRATPRSRTRNPPDSASAAQAKATLFSAAGRRLTAHEAPMPPPPLLPRLSPTPPPALRARNRGTGALPSPGGRGRQALLAVARARGKDEASFTDRILDYIEGMCTVRNDASFVLGHSYLEADWLMRLYVIKNQWPSCGS